jgi:predicted DNA-binding transcriptional regulator AlpA
MTANEERDVDGLLADLPEMIGRAQLAPLLGISRRSLDDWISEGRFPPPLRLSGRVHRWAKATIRRWLLASGAREGVGV